IVNWLWDLGDGSQSSDWSPFHLYDNPGLYNISLTVINDLGCVDTALNQINARIETAIFIPNSFTPNADGHNDYFMPYGNNIRQMEMWIFDRWGKNIFYTTDKESGWNGSEYTTGTYVYRIDIVDDEGKEYSYRGAIHLIK
ncbi:MAG: gliding motility-associated C-terminal domain-containing protein, partial [Flavobacteriales bacterium]|nr:gliding motility-associated C-terminal domain-containing protein [Flavobacteriales bacterium]